jgi:hypothetical protein
VGLAGGLAFSLVVERPPDEWLTIEYDRLSIAHLAFGAAALLFWLLIERAGDRFALDTSRLRLTWALGAAGIVGVAFLVLFPDFVRGPLAEVDPRLDPIFLGAVAELQPTFPTDSYTFGRFLLYLGPALFVVPYVASIAWRRRDDADGARWAFVAVLLVAYTVLALQYLRFVPFAEAPIAIGIAAMALAARDWLGSLPRIPARAAVSAAATVGLIVGSTVAGGAIAAAASTGPAAEGDAPRSCDVGAAATLLNAAAVAGDGPRIVLASIFSGPELLYRTPHSVLAGPYHRNHEGILDVFTAMTAADDATSLEVIERRGIGLVLLCPSAEETFFFRAGASETFYERLLAGRGPDWARPLSIPEELQGRVLLYEVDR